MAQVEVSPNPKRVKVFISPDGKLQKGSAEDYYMGHKLEGTRPADRVPEKPKAEEKKN